MRSDFLLKRKAKMTKLKKLRRISEEFILCLHNLFTSVNCYGVNAFLLLCYEHNNKHFMIDILIIRVMLTL